MGTKVFLMGRSMAAAALPLIRKKTDMSYYFIVTVSLTEEADTPYDSYIREVKPIVERHGGEYLVRTNEVTPLSPGWRPDRVIVIRFPSRESLERCFASEEYRQIKSLREESVDSHAIIVKGTDDDEAR